MKDISAKPFISVISSSRVVILMMPPVAWPSSAPKPPGKKSIELMNSEGNTLCSPKK